MVFRVAAKNFSLTFPQCSVSIEEMKKHMNTFLPKYLVIARELHEDGNPHIHVAIGFHSKKNIKDAKHFDYSGFHCNLQATKDLKNWIPYIKKHGDFIEEGVVNERIKLSDVTTDELFDYCVSKKIGYGYYCEEKRRRDTVSFDITENSEGKMSLYLQALVITDRSKSIVIVGDTGIGKTTWAINNCTKPALIVSHIDQLKSFRPGYHRSIIFDDMSFQQWPEQSQIHLADNDLPRSIHVRYGTASIPAKTEKIFTCNTRPFSEHPAISRRIHLVKIQPVVKVTSKP